jgi:translation initiation factor 1A
MPKKAGKKKNTKNVDLVGLKRALIYKENMEEYAQAIKMLGDRRILIMLPDKSESMAIIPGKFRKRCWIKVGDVIIISRREYQDNKLDVIHKYSDCETRNLAKEKEIPEFFLESSIPDKINDDENLLWEDSDDDDVEYIKQKLSYKDINLSIEGI